MGRPGLRKTPSYGLEFKRAAVQLSYRPGIQVQAVAEALDIHPYSFVSVSSDEFDELRAGEGRLNRVLSSANAMGHEVIDLRALRPLAMRGLEGGNPDVIRTIHGYDAALIWKGARASSPRK